MRSNNDKTYATIFKKIGYKLAEKFEPQEVHGFG